MQLEKIASITEHHITILGRLFEELNTPTLYKILKADEQHQLEPGDYLFRQGDEGNALYIVLNGRLRAVIEDKHGMHILGDIGEAEPTGKFALFTDDPRMASVLAIRSTTVLKINKRECLNLVAQNPALTGILTSFLLKRMRRNLLEQHSSKVPKNIALINLQPDIQNLPEKEKFWLMG